jgi:hypothetical protein
MNCIRIHCYDGCIVDSRRIGVKGKVKDGGPHLLVSSVACEVWVLSECPDGASVMVLKGWLGCSPLQPDDYFLYKARRVRHFFKRYQRLRSRAISLSGLSYCRGTRIVETRPDTRDSSSYSSTPSRGKNHCLGKQYNFTERSEGLPGSIRSRAWHHYDAAGADLRRSQYWKLTIHSWNSPLSLLSS